MSRLRVYNTLTRQKEEFRTVVPGKVGMYLCGPTVYKPSHIGHMVGPVIFDTVKRFLSYVGYEVTFVVNITDVDDKLIVRAHELNTTVKELAERMTADYLDCLKKLNVTGIDRMPRATEHISEMIDIMKGLIAKGHAYASGGDVYFDIMSDPDYGKLCNRDPEQLEAGSRIEVSDKKRNPGDFALWKSARPGEPAWESPWGPGRPGWHIECSAMSMKYLGKTLDIHGGGLDLKFPHHENELAQSESLTGEPFAHFWMHNGLLKMGDIKMAGSIGNVINIAELLQRHDAETVRFLMLGTHYRSPIELVGAVGVSDLAELAKKCDERLEEIRRSLDGFYRFFERYQRITREDFHSIAPPLRYATFIVAGISAFLQEVNRLRGAFLEAMEDDFNTGGAVGSLFELLTALNRFADQKHLEEPGAAAEALAEFRRGVVVLRELGQILGLFWAPPSSPSAGSDQLVGGLIQILLDLRDNLRVEAKQSKDPEVKKRLFAQTDLIRSRLNELGITLEDRKGGTGWRLG